MVQKLKFNKTEESIFTLLSLSVLTYQAYEALINDENILTANVDLNKRTFESISNDTIREALIYQILIKTCSFMDEWNGVFGVNTETKDKASILALKKIAKPATRNISSWRELKEFRNHYIAHNHRNKEGNNIYLNHKIYHSPQSVEEYIY